MALGTDYIIRYLADTKNAIAAVKALEQLNSHIAVGIGKDYANMTKIISTSFGKLSAFRVKVDGKEAIMTTQQLSVVAKNAAGRFYELQGTITKVGDQTQTAFTPAMKDVTDAQLNASKASKNLGENLAFLAKRALLVMPIWAALRAIMQATQRVFTEGFQDLVSESLALQKVKNTLQETGTALSSAMDTLKNETQSLAIETGISQDKIIASVQKFTSVGLDFATAMSATNAVTKLAVITQSDAINTADGLAHAFTVLIDSNLNATEKQKQINDVIALTAELYKTNGFNIEEFTGSLEKFAVTAKSVNFTTSQTVALLATLSKSGLGSAGNLLRNSIGQLLVNMDKLAGTLGVKVNPQLDNTFTILVKVLEQINQLKTTKNLEGLESAREAMKDIFGGTRSAVPIDTLSTLYDVLKKNLALTPDINKFNAAFKDTESVLGNVVARMHVVNSEIGEALVTGIVGGEDFADSLEKIVAILNKMIPIAESLGAGLAGAFSLGVIPIIDLTQKHLEQTNKEINKFGDTLVKGLRGELAKKQLDELIERLEKTRVTLGKTIVSKPIKSTAIFNEYDTLVKTIDLLKQAKKLEASPATIDTSTKKADNTEKQTINLKEQSLLNKEIQSVAKVVLANSIEQLKREGALTSQIILATQLKTEQLGIYESTIDKLKTQLDYERAINEEKRLQSRFSSDTIKLFEIAKTEGTTVAKNIGDVLSGNIDFAAFFRRGGKELEIFQKQFADLFQQQQALQFFTGERVSGLPELRGGANIPILEEATRLQALAPVVPITFDARFEISQLDEVKKLFIAEVTKQLPQIGTAVNKALIEALSGKQGTTL